MKSFAAMLFVLLAAGCYKSPEVVVIPDIIVESEARTYEVFAEPQERSLDASATEPAAKR